MSNMNPVKNEEGIVRHMLTDPYSNIFCGGLVIWRPVAFNVLHGPEFMNVNFKRVKNSWMAKVRLDLSCGFCNELTVCDHTIQGREVGGVTVFVEGEVPKNWTHLVVTGVSSLFKKTSEKAGEGEKQGAIFAEFGKPYNVEDYLKFRQRLSNGRGGYTRRYNSLLSEKVAFYEQIWPDEERPGTLRCILHQSKQNRVMWEYCHITEEAEADEGQTEAEVSQTKVGVV